MLYNILYFNNQNKALNRIIHELKYDYNHIKELYYNLINKFKEDKKILNKELYQLKNKINELKDIDELKQNNQLLKKEFNELKYDFILLNNET
jgi:predicted RNase H-like nuclease (RuvC/YqgF family)